MIKLRGHFDGTVIVLDDPVPPGMLPNTVVEVVVPADRAQDGTGRRQVDEQVVGDQRDGQVHDEQEGHGVGGLSGLQDVDVGQPQHQRHRDRHPREQPARLGADPGDDRPGQAGDHHADDGQLA